MITFYNMITLYNGYTEDQGEIYIITHVKESMWRPEGLRNAFTKYESAGMSVISIIVGGRWDLWKDLRSRFASFKLVSGETSCAFKKEPVIRDYFRCCDAMTDEDALRQKLDNTKLWKDYMNSLDPEGEEYKVEFAKIELNNFRDTYLEPFGGKIRSCKNALVSDLIRLGIIDEVISGLWDYNDITEKIADLYGAKSDSKWNLLCGEFKDLREVLIPLIEYFWKDR